jgi:hypothetical protein
MNCFCQSEKNKSGLTSRFEVGGVDFGDVMQMLLEISETKNKQHRISLQVRYSPKRLKCGDLKVQ